MTDILYSDNVEAPLTKEDVAALKVLHASLKKAGELAVKHQVRVTVDAEHTYVILQDMTRYMLILTLCAVGTNPQSMHLPPT